MEKIKLYTIIASDDPNKLMEKVNEGIELGLWPLGSPSVWHGYLLQAMVVDIQHHLDGAVWKRANNEPT